MMSLISSSTLFSGVPHEILVTITKLLVSPIDFLAFSSVCKSWQAAAFDSEKFEGWVHHFSSWPWLMLIQNNDDHNHREFYSVSKNTTFKVKLPETHNKRCFASKGWLITISRDLSVHLVDPLSRAQIQLPSLKSSLHFLDRPYYEATNTSDYNSFYFVNRVIVSSPTQSNSRIVMIIYGFYNALAFYELGGDESTNAKWTKVKCRLAPYMDVMHYKEGLFYAINSEVDIVSINVTAGPNAIVSVIRAAMPRTFGSGDWCRFYLVDMYSSTSTLLSTDTLSKVMVVCRLSLRQLAEEVGEFSYKTFGFKVFEVDLVDVNENWKKVDDIGSKALFLGTNSSFCMDVSKNDGIKPNCIYFTDDEPESCCRSSKTGGRDMGIFNLQDRRFTSHFQATSYRNVSPPLWVGL